MGWSGYRYDQPTRLYAVRFRFYDAVTFRWLNRDPAGYVDSMNLYGYGVSNPIGGMDPYGLERFDRFSGGDPRDQPGDVLNDPRLRELYFDPQVEGTQWGKPLMEGLGYGLIVPALILIPGPEDLVFAAAVAGFVRVGGTLYRWVKQGGRILLYTIELPAKALHAAFIRVHGGRAALAIGVAIDDVGEWTYEIHKRVRRGSDGGRSEHVIEKLNGVTNSVTHRVRSKWGRLIHQHQIHIGQCGSKRRFPDEWIEFPVRGEPPLPTGPLFPPGSS